MKKTSYGITAALVALLISATAIFASAARYMGDLNSDNRVTSADARILLRVSAKLDTLTQEQKAVADINSDTRVNSADARIALRMSAKLEEKITLPETSTDSGDVPNKPPVKPSSSITEEPTTTEAPNAKPDAEVLKDCYVDAEVVQYAEDGTEKKTDICCAYQSEMQKAGLVKKEVQHLYARTTGAVAGQDIGILLKSNLNSLGKVKQDIYMINYKTNEYLMLGSAVIDSMSTITGGMDMGELISPDDMLSVEIFHSLDKYTTTEETRDGEKFKVMREKGEDGKETVYYLRYAENSYYYPAITEMYQNGKLIQKVTIKELKRDASEYMEVPASMNGIRVEKLTDVADMKKLEAMMNFMNALGVSAN